MINILTSTKRTIALEKSNRIMYVYKVKTTSNRVEKNTMRRHPSKSLRSWNYLMNHELSKSQRDLETDPADSCHSSWAYKYQQTVSDIDLETIPGFHKLQEGVRICKGIPTASTYLNPVPLHPNQNPLRSNLQRSVEQHTSAHIKPPPDLLYKDH
jgi:ribosomal protein L39E